MNKRCRPSLDLCRWVAPRILPLVNRLSVRVHHFQRVEEMSGNGITSSGGANSGYRVAMVSGALEVSARLATAEDLDLLVRVLEANKILWTPSGTSEPNLQPEAPR